MDEKSFKCLYFNDFRRRSLDIKELGRVDFSITNSIGTVENSGKNNAGPSICFMRSQPALLVIGQKPILLNGDIENRVIKKEV